MLVEVVFPEALPVVAVDHEDRVFVEPELLVLVDDVLDEEVEVSDLVLVVVECGVLGVFLAPVAVDGTVVVVARYPEVGGHEGLVVVLLQPALAGLEHDVVFVAEVVGLLKARLVHVSTGWKSSVAEVLDDLRCGLSNSSVAEENHTES